MSTEADELRKQLTDLTSPKVGALSLRQSIFNALYKEKRYQPTLFHEWLDNCMPDAKNAYLVNELLRHVGFGNQAEAEKILEANPDLLFHRGCLTDIAKDTYTDITAFEYAIMVKDSHMAKMMVKIVMAQEGTKKKELASELSHQFENAFTEENPSSIQHLIDALQIYVDNFNAWNYEQLKNFWCTVVGLAQLKIPAHVRNEYCHPNRSFHPVPDFCEPELPRVLKFFNFGRDENSTWDDSVVGLGTDFGIYQSGGCAAVGRRGGAGAVGWGGVGADGGKALDLAAVTALCKVRTADLILLKQQLELIQQLDDTLTGPGQSSGC